MQKRKEQEVGSLLKSVLTSCGGKLPMNKLNAEYKTVVGCDIPYREFNHPNLNRFLQSIPDILKLDNAGGQVMVSVVSDKDIDMILRQVQEQKPESKTSNKKRKPTAHAPRHLHSSRPLLAQQHYWYSNVRNHIGAPREYGRNYMIHAPTTTTFGRNYNTRATTATITGRNCSTRTTNATATTNNNPQQNQRRQQDSVQQVIGARAHAKTPTKKTFKDQLMEAVLALDDSTVIPTYQTFCFGKKKLEWCTTIHIGDVLRVSNYPHSMNSREEAEEAASQKALQQLPQLAKKRKAAQQNTTADYNVSIPRVKKILEEKSPIKRFWWEAVQGMYWDRHQERLPKEWITTVKSRNNTGLEFDNPCADMWTIALEHKSPSPEPSDPESQNTSTSHEQEQPHLYYNSESENSTTDTEGKLQLPPLSLPTTPTWDVFITCMKDPSTIYLRLVGEEYSDMYDEVLSEMELYYTEPSGLQPVKEATVGDMYATKHEDTWFRVEVLEVIGEKVKVKLVDEGYSIMAAVCELYDLHERFFSLPPQSLRCCLAGLEDAPWEATLRAFLEIVPTSQALVARVQRRQEPYALIFFDTSTSEDINLNDKVFESLTQHLTEPFLPPVGCVAEVYLTYASQSGIVYFQENSDTLATLNELLKTSRRCIKDMAVEANVDVSKLYLARFNGDEEWYRALPKNPVDEEGKVVMEFVDFGNLEKVAINNIRNFEPLCPLLAKVPHQALPCHLYKVPCDPELRWTVEACQRLVELTSQDTPLLLKVVSIGTSSELPEVQLFKRLMPQNELISINDTLGLDTKLFSKEGKTNNVDKDVVLCHIRSQLSSCVSGANVPSEPLTVGPDSFLPCPAMALSDIPDVGSYFDVFVTFAASPHLFAVQPWNMSKKYGELCDGMQKYYNNPSNLKQVMKVKGGQYCALKHKDDVWYRAKVEMAQNETVAGVFVDFGDRFVSSLQKVQPLVPLFCILPCLAIKAKLYGIEAANKAWSPEDALRFRTLAGNKNLSSVVYGKEMDKNGSLLLSLLLIDTSDKAVDIYINQLLVEENRAVYLWAETLHS